MVWIFLFLSAFFIFFDFFYIFVFFSFFILFFVFGWGGFSFSGLFFLDNLSFFLVFLSALVFLYCSFSSFADFWVGNFFSSFVFYMVSIFFFLFLSFSCLSVLFFYISFEFVFVLMFFYLLTWGYSPERLSASFYMIFYTLVVSFPFLVFLVSIGDTGGKFLCLVGRPFYWWCTIFLVFMVKLPVYGAHLWLPKAHVEAPVSGSMVLAGVLLKLGVYGFLRFLGGSLAYLSFLGGYLVSLGLLGGVYSCYLCLRQVDLKSLVAYSSVCHMGYGLGGLLTGSYSGYLGAVFMAIAHGFCSSCLFYVLYVLYERYHTRSGVVLKGLGYLVPLVLLVWFSFSALNMGVPPSFSFFSEVFILWGVSGFNFFTFFFSGFLLLFAGIYGIYFYVVSCHSSSFLGGLFISLTSREFLNFYGHLFFLLFLVISSDFFFI